MIRLSLLMSLVTLTLGQETVSQPEIILDRASADIFPEEWRGGRVNASAEPLEEDQVERLRRILERALAKYPPALLNATLKRIHGVGRLRYHGISAGGTRSSSAVYVACRSSYTDDTVERILHGEISSIFFIKHRKQFDAEAWKQINPPDFQYLGSGVAAAKAGKVSTKMDASLHGLGFLHEYSQASIEEDFNSHATWLMTGDEAYWRALEAHPKLKAKAALAMRFYASLDSGFTEARVIALRHDLARDQPEHEKQNNLTERPQAERR